ncbi:MAG: TolC family protein, partial [Candidatus Dadabacteria bacterium]|nr:TolC family protein [Candidatus Dadabacteria bacterium]NIQ16823.1 TolC family protein [Candidatus Dadabacteria bacterium]
MRENKITNVLTTIVLFIISVLSFAAFPNSSYSEIKTVNVSIVFDGPSPLNSNTLSLYKEEITKITEGEFIVNFPENKIITSDWNYINIQRIIDQILSDPQVDILITAGVISSYEVSKRIDLSKPVIAPFIIDQKLQSIPINDSGSSGINNLNYISGGSVIDREFKVFHDIVNFKKLAFVFMSFIPERFPELKNNVKNSTEKINADIVFIPAGNSAKEVLELIPDDVDAIYITSLLTFSEQEISNLISGINNRKLPSFSMLGREEVSKGVLISLNSDTDFLRIARRVALNFQDILLGNNAGSLPVAFKNQEELVINMETARSINFFPEWKWLTEADVLYEDISDIKRKISLKSAVEESVRLNLDLLTARQEVEVGKENVRQAISQLLPQINTALDYTIIDEDRAESFSGSQSERTFTGSINLEQSIFSEPLWSNLGIQKNLQEARRANKKITELDIIQSTAIAYLNVLITKTFEKTQKENLKVTKSNLELAKIRNEVGEASPSEVFRWESELASDRVDVVTAEAETKKAQITL